jgi:hypothetical protein
MKDVFPQMNGSSLFPQVHVAAMLALWKIGSGTLPE